MENPGDDRFPWLCYVQRLGEDKTDGVVNYEYKTLCIGTFLSKDVVLTGKHCVKEPVTDKVKYRVIYGKGSMMDARSKAPKELLNMIGGGEDPFNAAFHDAHNYEHLAAADYESQKSGVHEIKTIGGENSDAVLLKITPVEFSKYVNFVCLPDGKGNEDKVGTEPITTVGCCAHDKYVNAANAKLGGPKTQPSKFENTRYIEGKFEDKEKCKKKDSGSTGSHGLCIEQLEKPTKTTYQKCFSHGGGPAAKKIEVEGVESWMLVGGTSFLFGKPFRPCTCVCFYSDYPSINKAENQAVMDHAYFQPIDQAAIIDAIGSFTNLPK